MSNISFQLTAIAVTEENVNTKNNKIDMKLLDIEMAFDYVSSNQPDINNAYISRSTGEVYYTSEMYDSDELPDDIDDEDKYIIVPHKNELNLGRGLVFEFVSKFLPGDLDTVYDLFGKKGAYSRFKNLLERQGKLEQWHQYEDEKFKATILGWCKDNDIVIDP